MTDPTLPAWSRENDLLFQLRRLREENERLLEALALAQPPQRTWVGLTDEDISEIVRGTHNTGSFVRAIEAKLKEKNI